MTDGTSQGLFIVVAIVIFGIFTVMAYILFEDTLSPALANMFSEATEQASTRLNSGVFFETTSIEDLVSSVNNRFGTSRDVVIEDAKEAMMITFDAGTEGIPKQFYDVFVYLDKSIDNVPEGTDIKVTFQAKADKDVNLGTRLGANLYNEYVHYSNVTEDWKTYEVIMKKGDTGLRSGEDFSSVVFWVDAPATIYLADLKVSVGY